jgi:NTP pyrophosphatase (non-canonical NTP hydrolase)
METKLESALRRGSTHFDVYQHLARQTANEDGSVEHRMVNWALGISGEAGEVADILKKHVFHGHELDKQELSKEIGDILWYLSNLAFELDIFLGDIAEENLKKLMQRYPEGFSEERSINRKEYKR